MTFLHYAAHKPAPCGIPTTALGREREEKGQSGTSRKGHQKEMQLAGVFLFARRLFFFLRGKL